MEGMYHSILINALWHSYLYKCFYYTWQETNVSFHSYRTCNLITLGRSLMYHYILTCILS